MNEIYKKYKKYNSKIKINAKTISKRIFIFVENGSITYFKVTEIC